MKYLPELRELNVFFHYSPDTGILTAKKERRNVQIGVTLGCVDTLGYLAIGFNGTRYYVHRIVWKMHHGDFEEHLMVDHVNGKKHDNRIDNLRLVDKTENARNMKASTKNTSGYTGVSLYKPTGRWMAIIQVSGKHVYLGSFKTKKEAAKARCAADKKYGFHENHGRLV